MPYLLLASGVDACLAWRIPETSTIVGTEECIIKLNIYTCTARIIRTSTRYKLSLWDVAGVK